MHFKNGWIRVIINLYVLIDEIFVLVTLVYKKVHKFIQKLHSSYENLKVLSIFEIFSSFPIVSLHEKIFTIPDILLFYNKHLVLLFIF